jgi:hypothetical protein
MATETLLRDHPPRNGQSGNHTGWPEEEEYIESAFYQDDFAGPDEWDDEGEDDWEEPDDYDWEDDEDYDDDDDWDDDYYGGEDEDQ